MKNLRVLTLRVLILLFLILSRISLGAGQDALFKDNFDEDLVDIDPELLASNEDSVDSKKVHREVISEQPADNSEESKDSVNEPSGSSKSDSSKIVLTEAKDDSEIEKDKGKNRAEVETIDLPEEKIGIQGNWIKKREWVKESYKVNQQIQDIVSEIQKLRYSFQDKFTKINNELELFYKQESLNQGTVKALFNDINRYLDKKKNEYSRKLKEGVTSVEEVELATLLRDTKILKKELKQLMLDIKSVDQIDKSLNDRLKKLDEFLKMSLDESVMAKKMVDEIWYIIDDLKARDIYYKLKGDSLEKVKAIKKYLAGSFQTDFNNLLSTIRDQFAKISEHIKDLEKRGLIIKNRSERLDVIRQKKVEKKNKLPNKIENPQDLTTIQKIYKYTVYLAAKIHNFLSEM